MDIEDARRQKLHRSDGRPYRGDYYDTFMLVQWANDRLREAGFEKVCVSLKTEATYWRLPGRYGNLRVAAHQSKGKDSPAGMTVIVARLTFIGGRKHPQLLSMRADSIERELERAIGQYVMRSTVERSNYDGPNDEKHRLKMASPVAPHTPAEQ